MLMRNYSLKWGVVTILSINCCPRLKHYLWNCVQPIVCLLSHNVITTCINLHLFSEICFWTLIEIFCFCTVFVIFVRWRLSVGIKRFTYLLTYLLTWLTADLFPSARVIDLPRSHESQPLIRRCTWFTLLRVDVSWLLHFGSNIVYEFIINNNIQADRGGAIYHHTRPATSIHHHTCAHLQTIPRRPKRGSTCLYSSNDSRPP